MTNGYRLHHGRLHGKKAGAARHDRRHAGRPAIGRDDGRRTSRGLRYFVRSVPARSRGDPRLSRAIVLGQVDSQGARRTDNPELVLLGRLSCQWPGRLRAGRHRQGDFCLPLRRLHLAGTSRQRTEQGARGRRSGRIPTCRACVAGCWSPIDAQGLYEQFGFTVVHSPNATWKSCGTAYTSPAAPAVEPRWTYCCQQDTTAYGAAGPPQSLFSGVKCALVRDAS